MLTFRRRSFSRVGVVSVKLPSLLQPSDASTSPLPQRSHPPTVYTINTTATTNSTAAIPRLPRCNSLRIITPNPNITPVAAPANPIPFIIQPIFYLTHNCILLKPNFKPI
ncbi:hypothetical protein U1Q18_010779 [Sarracenia purpurea var. burkii]